MKLDKDNIKKIRGLILFTILVLVILWNYSLVFGALKFVWTVVFPFVLGGCIAFVLNVPMSFFEKKLFGKAKEKEKKWALKLARPISFLVTLIVVVGVIAIVIFGVVPELGRTILTLSNTIQDFIPKAQEWAIETFKENEEIVDWVRGIEFDWENITKKLFDFVQKGAGSILGTTYEAAMSIINGVTTFFIAFVFSCYILLQKEKLTVQIKKLLHAFMPEDWRNIVLALSSVVYKSFSNFLTGQCLEAVILGLMFLVAMLIFGMPYALLISVLIAFTALIPIFGAFIGCIVGAFLIFMVDPVKALIFIIMFLVLQQIEGNFIYPHVVGNSVGLPSIWVLVAVTLGADLMGIAGMLIAIPLTSVVYTMLRGIVNRRLGLKE